MRRETTLKNNVDRELPTDLLQQMNYQPFATTEIGHPEVQRVAPKVRVTTGDDKVVYSISGYVKRRYDDFLSPPFS